MKHELISGMERTIAEKMYETLRVFYLSCSGLSSVLPGGIALGALRVPSLGQESRNLTWAAFWRWE